MVSKRTRNLISGMLLLGVLFLAAFACTDTTYADDSGASIVTTSTDIDYCMEVSKLSQSSPDAKPGKVQSAKRSAAPAESDPATRLLVVYEGSLDLSGLNGLAGAVIGDNGLCVIQFESVSDAEAAYSELSTWEQVRSVEFDAILTAYDDTGSGSDASGYTDAEGQTVSYGKIPGKDSHYSWGVSSIGADVYSDYIKSIDHGQQIVAVIDSGIDADHSFFNGRLLPGYDFVDRDDEPEDDDGHGTHVSGTIVDCTMGINDIMILPIKILNGNGSGSFSNAGNALLFSVENGASVINMSLGGVHSTYLDTAISHAISNGAIVVTASGNEGHDISEYMDCPAHIAEVITVGSVNKLLKAEKYSNYGARLDFVAPGEDITSTIPGGRVITWSGTSMAAPHVSACVALVRMNYPGATNKKVASILARSCRKYSDTKHYGKGMVNLRNLLANIANQKITVKKSVVYTGNPIKAKVTVSRNGEALFKGSDYTVSYSNNIKVGKATAVIKGQGTYSGKKVRTFKIVPKGTSLRSTSPSYSSFTVKWKKQAVQTSGYQIQYGTKKSLSGAKIKTVTGKSKTSTKITKLKSKQKYYVRVRTFKTVNGTKYCSAWSAKRSVKTR